MHSCKDMKRSVKKFSDCREEQRYSSALSITEILLMTGLYSHSEGFAVVPKRMGGLCP